MSKQNSQLRRMLQGQQGVADRWHDEAGGGRCSYWSTRPVSTRRGAPNELQSRAEDAFVVADVVVKCPSEIHLGQSKHPLQTRWMVSFDWDSFSWQRTDGTFYAICKFVTVIRSIMVVIICKWLKVLRPEFVLCAWMSLPSLTKAVPLLSWNRANHSSRS